MLVLVPSLTHAWGADGHRIVGAIAEAHLTDDAKAAVVDLLGDETLADVSTWADTIKGDRPETRPWHYMNPPKGVQMVTLDHCPPEGCVLSKTIEFAEVLADKNRPKEERAEALKWVVHLVGDIHCPLHVSRAKDRGGNDIRVEFQGGFTNLHRLWDSGLIRSTREPWREMVERLNTEFEEPSARWRKDLGEPEDWATESYNSALRTAYPIPESMVIEDDPEYRERALEVIEMRLYAGGVRLAALLNRVLGQPRGL